MVSALLAQQRRVLRFVLDVERCISQFGHVKEVVENVLPKVNQFIQLHLRERHRLVSVAKSQ